MLRTALKWRDTLTLRCCWIQSALHLRRRQRLGFSMPSVQRWS